MVPVLEAVFKEGPREAGSITPRVPGPNLMSLQVGQSMACRLRAFAWIRRGGIWWMMAGWWRWLDWMPRSSISSSRILAAPGRPRQYPSDHYNYNRHSFL